jgi:hypothetical protein
MSEYLLTQDEAEQLEQTRLALPEEFADPLTRRLLDLLGWERAGAASTSGQAPAQWGGCWPGESGPPAACWPPISTPASSRSSPAPTWRCAATIRGRRSR